MPDGSNHIPERVESILDQRLDDGVVHRSDDDSRVREALELQDRIDASLRRQFEPDDVDRLVEGVRAKVVPAAEGEREKRHRGRVIGTIGMRSWGRRAAMAAALVLAVFGGWLIWSQLRPSSSGYDIGPWRDFGTAYADFVSAGFKEQWECESEEVFFDAFATRLGEGLVIRDLDSEARVLGLSYCHTMSRNTIAVLAYVRGEPVVVFVDRADFDVHSETWNTPAALNRFKRRAGDLVIHEVTPFDEPLVGPALTPDREGDSPS